MPTAPTLEELAAKVGIGPAGCSTRFWLPHLSALALAGSSR
jgi:hypothetical protein